MEFKLNSSPHLKKSDITKLLFNRDFHSDVQFSVEGQTIYAHSLELIKSSVVFEHQLEETVGVKKLIPIVDCKYKSFLEFIRFIYTDECAITEDNGIEILKLATQYKVILLENKVINFRDSVQWYLQLFEHCAITNYELIRNVTHHNILFDFFGLHLFVEELFETKPFLSLHPDAVDELLKFECVPNGLTEVQLFTALGNWITSYCDTHQIALSERRQRFDKLIRKIRFPTMSNEEFRDCILKYQRLLNKSDCTSIAEQIVLGSSDSGNDLWISKRREEYIDPYEWCTFIPKKTYETVLSISKETILHGIRIGNCSNLIEMGINTKDGESSYFRLAGFDVLNVTINLGNTLQLKSKREYKITIKYLGVPDKNKKLLLCRKAAVRAIINDASKSVHIIKISRNVFEMFFKSPTD